MSVRERLLLSLFSHIVLIVILVVTPELPWVKAAAARRAERLAELAETQLQALRNADDGRMFVIVEPLIDREALEPPAPDAPFSDIDRNAQSRERAENPENRLPLAEGTSAERIEAPPAPRDERPVERPAEPVRGAADEPTEGARGTAQGEGPQEEGVLAQLMAPDDPLGRSSAGGSASARAGEGRGNLLGQALENLNRFVQEEGFGNLRGDTGQFGPWIQFDTKGVEFGPWIRRFVAQIRRNWFIPYAAMSMKGHTAITFYVHKDGALTDVTVLQPSSVDAFNRSAFNALIASNPTYPLPPEYPDDQAFFTVTFYYNESPPQ